MGEDNLSKNDLINTLKSLLEKDQDILKSILEWAEGLDGKKQKEFLEKLSEYSLKDIKLFASFDSRSREAFLKLIRKKNNKKASSDWLKK